MFAVPSCAPVCAHPFPSSCRPDGSWWPGQEEAVMAPAQRGTGRMFCAPCPQADHSQPVLNLPQGVPVRMEPGEPGGL